MKTGCVCLSAERWEAVSDQSGGWISSLQLSVSPGQQTSVPPCSRQVPAPTGPRHTHTHKHTHLKEKVEPSKSACLSLAKGPETLTCQKTRSRQRSCWDESLNSSLASLTHDLEQHEIGGVHYRDHVPPVPEEVKWNEMTEFIGFTDSFFCLGVKLVFYPTWSKKMYWYQGHRENSG